ncbi:glycogen debranching protein GlgX [Nakamurella sp. YIM 132087]|uniref:Glycogen debranching protein GlgX n=1 Tax=Nakamurella alba TaxID=2665158 RepID=A0A7K1FU62_9ACTN|nr:glycogen debranching protein GlgX [Nakamurella alba]MTD16723.1 glycogen debranching protein GlgX [Nakamurella alba]
MAPPSDPPNGLHLAALPGAAGTSIFPGTPFPLGAHVVDGGTNFSVVADTEDIELCLVNAQGEELCLPLQERTYGIWHTFVPGVGAGQRYGYRVRDRDPSKILLDPYARRLDSTAYDLEAASTPGADTLGKVPLGMVTGGQVSTSPRPEVPWAHTVIYEAHLVGMTRRHPAVPPRLRGTYLGMANPAIIDHLKSLGVTTVELLPVHAHADEPGLVASGRTNYWGYATLSFFAPHPAYATAPGRENAEFVAMVDALHGAGIEVMLDVVYNHTCEGGAADPITLAYRGLAPDRYYLPPGHDITGTGNTLDPAGMAVIRLVTDSLRHWAALGVDGFRFDLASVLGRPHGGHFDAGSALLSAIAADPVLSQRKLIAEPWDATGEGYAVGRFGAHWSEWNDRYRDGVRDFWRGVGGVRNMGYRLSGSQDLYGDRRPWASINFVTAHDGFTLRDLVSYDHKHNETNGEGNRDGTDNNRSSGYGAEGETDDPAIREIRLRQARNIVGTLLLSSGTPMLTMGDELWRTQGGNNNAYCQDNDTSWVDWAGLLRPDGSPVSGTDEADMLAFVTRTLALRIDSPALHQAEFFEGRAPVGGDGVADLVWFSPDGNPMTDGDWFDDGRHTLMMWLDGRDVRGHTAAGGPLIDDSWLLVLHAGADPVEISLPGRPYGDAYTREIDTASPTGEPREIQNDPLPLVLAAGLEMTLPGRTLWLLRAHRDPA